MIKFKPVFLVSEEIAQICRISVKRIGYYVEHHGLPAFKDSDAENAKWKGRHESIIKWSRRHEEKFIKKPCQ